MLRVTILLFLLLLLPIGMPAQNAQIYVAAGLGTHESKATSQFAVGGETVLRKRFGVGGEIGLAAGHSSFGFLVGNASYHFRDFGGPAAAGKLDPFLLGGAGGTLDFGGSAPLASFGGGVNYWFRRNVGLRVEVRDLAVLTDRYGSSRHFWSFRAGLCLR